MMKDTSSVEMIVVKVDPFKHPERPILWLCEKDAERPFLLPIVIGQFEAAAIQMELEREEPLRPISYDLLASIMDQLDVPVRYVHVHSAQKQIFYARVAIEREGDVREIDSRPSDAVALALRTGAPIFVARDLLELSGIEPEDGEAGYEPAIERFTRDEPQVTEAPSAPFEATTAAQIEEPDAEVVLEQRPPEDRLSRLQSQMAQAVVCEEYEEAARLRDEIERLASETKSA
jgi:uncharacterized protein